MVMMVATDTPHTPPANISQGQVGSHHPSRCRQCDTTTPHHTTPHQSTNNHGGKYIGSSSVSRQTNHLRGISPRISQDGSLSCANTARKSARIQVRDIVSCFITTIILQIHIKIERYPRQYCWRLLNILCYVAKEIPHRKSIEKLLCA